MNQNALSQKIFPSGKHMAMANQFKFLKDGKKQS
jgi:hypothetical protein